jgi:hypothetical protein
LYFICSDVARSTLKLLQIRGSSVVAQIHFKMGYEIRELDHLASSVFSGEQIIRAVRTKSPVKFYNQGDVLYASIESGVDAATYFTILKLNKLTREVSKWTVKDRYRSNYNSFISGDYFFKITKKKNFEVEIYSIDRQKLLNSFLVDDKSPMLMEKSFMRIDESNVVKQNTVNGSIKDKGNCFLVAYADSSTVTLKIGTLSASGSVPIVSAAGGAVLIFTMGIRLATSRPVDKSFDHYFYMKGDVEKGFNYLVDNDEPMDKKIDLYELRDRKNKTSYGIKSYVVGRNHIYAIYKDMSYPKELKIITHQ